MHEPAAGDANAAVRVVEDGDQGGEERGLGDEVVAVGWAAVGDVD